MSRASRVLAGVSRAYALLAVSTVFGLWFTPFLLRHVDVRDFGLWSAGVPILAYVGLVDFGVLTIFQREVAFALGKVQGDFRSAQELPALVGTTLKLVLLQLPALLAGMAIAWLCLPRSWAPLHVPLGLTLGCLFVAFPWRTYHALLMGLQDLRFLGSLAIAAWTMGAALSAVLVFRGWGLNALAVSWCATQLITYGGCYFRVKTRFSFALSGGIPPLSRHEAFKRLRKGFWVIVSQLAVMLATGADLLVIAAVLGPAKVTPYTITDKLVTMLNSLPFMIMASAQPALSELSSSADRKRLPIVCIALTRVVLLVSGLIAGVVIVVNRGFIGWWIGPEQFGGSALVLALVADMVISHWTSATAYSLFSFGYERFISLVSIASGAATIALTVILTKHVGLIGAPLASLAARALLALPLFLVATARATDSMVTRLFLPVLPWAWRMVLFAAGAIEVTRLWTLRSPFALAAAGLVATVVYGVLMLPLLLAEPVGPYVRPRLAALGARMSRRP